jgi:8-oxo-dGTP pyrophosphatase MutT (NUDIX family)
MMRRHRFIVDRWVWEPLGGYVDDGEDPAAAAVRYAEEETGWRPRAVEFVLSRQPRTSAVKSGRTVGEPSLEQRG